MALTIVRFLAVLFAALALVPAAAHLMELPNKIRLPREDYLTVQHIYRGWALAGFLVAGAMFSALARAIMVRGDASALVAALIAFLCIVGTQVVFWTFTAPANRATRNWTMLPPNWMEVRVRWEYSHAASAALNLIALIAVILSVLPAGE